jgi:hypothetical protein
VAALNTNEARAAESRAATGKTLAVNVSEEKADSAQRMTMAPVIVGSNNDGTGKGPSLEVDHDAIMRRLAEIAHAAGASRAEVERLNSQSLTRQDLNRQGASSEKSSARSSRAVSEQSNTSAGILTGQAALANAVQPASQEQIARELAALEEAAMARLVTDQANTGMIMTKQPVMEHTAQGQTIEEQFGASRLGNPERVRPPQFSAVPDSPQVRRSAKSGSPGPRMQHPSINRLGLAADLLEE